MEQCYSTNQKSRVGDAIHCPTCEKSFKKKSYNQKFCCSKCKDTYWNTVDDTRRERAKMY